MSEHTKLPWRVWEERGEFTICTVEDEAWYIADCHGGAGPAGRPDPVKANAELIVRAVNSLASNEAKIDALTNALEEIRTATFRNSLLQGFKHSDADVAELNGRLETIRQLVDAALSSHTEQEGK